MLKSFAKRSRSSAENLKMSATNPIKMWIDGKIFSVNNLDDKKAECLSKSVEDLIIPDITECDRESTNVEKSNAGPEKALFITKFKVPAHYYKQINWNYDLKELELETKTKVVVPRNPDEDCIKITGKTLLSVADARNELHSIIADIRDKSKALQFISVPTRSEEIRNNVEKFKEEVLEMKLPGVDESIFMPKLKLHLTVCVMSLYNEFEVAYAKEAFQEIKSEILSSFIGKEQKIKISGIECMQTNLEKVNVLFAKAQFVDETEEKSLQKLLNTISDFYYKKGLVRTYKDTVKLHVTLMNTRYRKTEEQNTYQKKRRWPKKTFFDARQLMEKYKDHNFGECLFSSVNLSLMSTIGEDGFYKSLDEIQL